MASRYAGETREPRINPGQVNGVKKTGLLLPLMMAAVLLLPARLPAATAIVLNADEKILVGQGDIIVREVTTTDKPGRTFEALGLVNASKNTIVRVLTAYEYYPEFMPNVSRIDIVGHSGDGVVLNYTLSLPLGKIKKYRLKMSGSEEDDKSARLQWHLQEWPGLKISETIKDTTGYWLIDEKTPHSSMVLYHVYTDPGPVPVGLGWIIDVLSKNSVPEALVQTKARAERIDWRANPETPR